MFKVSMGIQNNQQAKKRVATMCAFCSTLYTVKPLLLSIYCIYCTVSVIPQVAACNQNEGIDQALRSSTLQTRPRLTSTASTETGLHRYERIHLG